MEVQEKAKVLLEKIPFGDTHSFSKAFLNYMNQQPELASFYNRFPTIENMKMQLEERNFSNETRQVLHDSLLEQYQGFELSEKSAQNIAALKDGKTFTITTGHQLNIFTGPLYFVYKIITVINACQELKKAYPDYHFVPVYWMASEDHDFEEISYFRYQGKKFTWNTDQTGAVGRFNPKSLQSIFDEIHGLPDLFREAYLKQPTLAKAVRHYVNALFGETGLVVMDADDVSLKNILKPVILADVLENTPHSLVTSTNAELEDAGYTAQVFPREINFFYLKDDLRARIVQEGEEFSVLDSSIHFTTDSIREEIESHPERFSPNVVLRPLYQELILPNLAYVGGPSELVYWLQLKAVFDHFETAFPMLMPRNFAGVLNHNTLRKVKKSELSFQELFLPEDELIREKVKANAKHELDLQSELERLHAIFDDVMKQAVKVDSTLERLVAAERKKTERCIAKIEKKLLKAEKRNQEVLVDRISAIKSQLFPNGAPQERKDNFLNFYLADPSFLDQCLEHLEPFDYRFHLLLANE